MGKLSKIIGILFGLLILTGTLWQSIVIIHFYANRQAIEDTYCINKERPQMNCHGQCHLNKSLGQTSSDTQIDSTQPSSPRSGLIVLRFQSTTNCMESFSVPYERISYAQLIAKTATFIPSVFDPPKYA